MSPAEGDPDLRSASLWTARVQQLESKFLQGPDRDPTAGWDTGEQSMTDLKEIALTKPNTMYSGSVSPAPPTKNNNEDPIPDFLLFFLPEGQEMQQDQEVARTSEVYLRRLLQREEIPAQVLRLVRGRPLLHAPADQDREDAVPVRRRGNVFQERHDDPVLQVQLQLPAPQRGVFSPLQPVQ